MSGNELIVAFFALAFLAFCLTAVALYALSQGKDDVADKSVSGLRNLNFSSLTHPQSKKEENEQPDHTESTEP